jgi:hypothetical protein
MFAVFPSFIHSYINGYLPSIHMKASRPNACKCNVNLFHFVIVLFSKVVRQWGICNIFFYIIYSIYDIILSASSTYLQAPVTFLQDPSAVTLLQDPPAATCSLPAVTCSLPAVICSLPAEPSCSYPPAGPSCSYLFPSCRYLLPSCRYLLPSCRYLLPSCRNHAHRTLLQDPPAVSKTDLQEPFASCKKIPQYPKMVHRGVMSGRSGDWRIFMLGGLLRSPLRCLRRRDHFVRYAAR